MTGNKITKSKNFKMTELVRYYRLHYGGFGREVEQLSTLGFFYSIDFFCLCHFSESKMLPKDDRLLSPIKCKNLSVYNTV